MGTFQHVLHSGARPVSMPEFMDAVRATCKPRFPHARGTRYRQAAVAVSGGVDSMALAFLCSQLRKHCDDFKISDNPVSGFRGLVIDHGLREGSQKEGLAVCEALRDLGFVAELLPLSWSKVLGDYSHPKDLPNFESVARTLRYRKLGLICTLRHAASLLMAHQEDDQYETVLMRLLQGHGSRGLRGMQKARDIPECEGIFGADGSGFVDDQMHMNPFYNMKPSKKQRKKMYRELKSNISYRVDEADSNESDTKLPNVDLEEFYQSKPVSSYETSSIDVEDGGVTVYRPLLEFSKDRLIATCLENNVPWWEDATNMDPTLTMRNAVRHLYKGYTLPEALQKPAILALSKRCELRVQAQEAEANRLLSRTIIHDFEPLAGTVTVQFPDLAHCLSKRDSLSPLRRHARLQKRREVAAILIRKILMLVTPESQPPLLSTLENHVARLFPSLANPDEAALANPPRAFNLSGVHLVPIGPETESSPTTSSERTAGLSWHLSRAPYASTLPLPRVRTRRRASSSSPPRRGGQWKWTPRMPWTLWDGRYWVHVEHRLPHRLVVQPFLASHAKAFRERLAPPDRAPLAAALRHLAPGKARYTLPAVYLEEPLDLDLTLGPHGPAPRPDEYPNPPDAAGDEGEEGEGQGQGEDAKGSPHPKVRDPSKMMLVALPTLDMRVPGLDDWVACGIRYRRVDRDTLKTAGTFRRGSFAAPGAAGMRFSKGGVVRGPVGIDQLRRICRLRVRSLRGRLESQAQGKAVCIK
ncbi:adenine nucleotide alpha hydrolases-like protein [Hypoxylon cercidicola]|nr:adenine nucleotide alpha hydrolases-like protein [Hypoxylon cercidicola]